MPKVRRKRSTAITNNQLTRPKNDSRKTTKPIVAHNQQIKATYFDLAAEPKRSIKSKSTGKFIHLSKPPKHLNVSDDWDVKPGDVLSWSQGRPTETFFVTSEGTLLRNPDTSGSGYLTIPFSISSMYSDVIDHFLPVLDQIGRQYVSSIEIAPTDSFFMKNFSKELPTSIKNRTNITYSFNPYEEILCVTSASNPNQSQDFSVGNSTIDDIIQYISTMNETKTSFIVKFNFEGKETCSKVPRGIIRGLPTGWQCTQQGSLTFGDNKIQGEWKCEGPEKTQEKARKAVAKHYKGLDFEIK